jgi:hypothetical protein
MTMKESDYPEVFELAEPLEFPNAVDVYPPRPDSNGKFLISELLHWFDLMDDVLRTFKLICTFFRLQLASMGQDAERAKRLIAEIDAQLPLFTRRNPIYIPTQQRCKDRCVMVVADLLICTGDVECIQILSRYIAGSAGKWPLFSRAVVENHLSGKKDWREANSPAKWVKTTTNNLADKEYWVLDHAVNPAERRDVVSVEEIAELPVEAAFEPKYTQRSIAELEAAASEDADVKAYINAKVRYPDWQCQAIWNHLGWDEDRGKRVDRRYRRLRKRIRELGGGIQCREYRPRPGISDANFTTYFEELFDGAQGRRTGVWQHRDPYRDQAW